MMTLEELHAHYRAVRERINDKSKIKVQPMPKKPSRVVIQFTEPTFVNPSDQIVWRVAHAHGVSVADLKGTSRKQNIVIARQEAAWRLRTERNLTLNQIGALLGHKDHTTMLHAVKCHEKRLAKLTESLDEPSHVSSDR